MSRIFSLLLPRHLPPANAQGEKGTSKCIIDLKTSWYVVISPLFSGFAHFCHFRSPSTQDTFGNICADFRTVCPYPEWRFNNKWTLTGFYRLCVSHIHSQTGRRATMGSAINTFFGSESRVRLIQIWGFSLAIQNTDPRQRYLVCGAQ